MSQDRDRFGVPLWRLALIALYIGATGYGGPAIIGHVRRVFLERRKWIDEDTFLTGLSLSQMLPGATVANLMAFLGAKVSGPWGALISPLAFIAPAFCLMIFLSAIYFTYGTLPVIQALFTGLGAVVVALLLNTTVNLGRSALRDIWCVIIAVLSFLALQLLHLHVLIVIVAAAGAGLSIYRGRLAPLPEQAAASEASPRRIRWLRLLPFAGLLVLLIAVLALTSGSTLTRLFLALLRVGILSFGSGFASIPLFQQEAVYTHHWLTVRQFLDGLALGQITPGPVLITGTFIGYHLKGLAGALVSTAATFGPALTAMFFLARRHERFTNARWARAMIQGVVAAFIGVLASVAVKLGLASLTSWKAFAIFLPALAVLLLWKKDPLWVILGGAALSLVLFL